MKRALSFVLALCLLIACVPLSASAATKLTDPINVQWSTTTPGTALFDHGDPQEASWLELTLYKAGETANEDKMLYSKLVYYDTSFDTTPYLEGSGTYYFTVQAISDMNPFDATVASQAVKSDDWAYAGPSQQLEAVKSLTQNGSMLTWAAPQTNIDKIDSIEFQFYFSESATGPLVPFVAGREMNPRASSYSISWMLEQLDPGDYYTCKARYVSKDATEVANGEWSDFMPRKRYTPATQKLGAPTLTWNFPSIDYTIPTSNKSWIESITFIVFYAAQEDDTPEAITNRWYQVGSDLYKPPVNLADLLSDKGGLKTGYYTVESRLDSKDVTIVQNSDWAKSDVYHYTAPSAKLETVQNLVWNGTTVTYDLPTTNADKAYISIDYYFAENLGDTPQLVDWYSSEWYDEGMTGTASTSYALSENGSGYYTAKATFRSKDITQVLDGDTATSAPYQYTAPTQKLQDVDSLTWDGQGVTYDAPTANENLIDDLRVDVYYSPTSDGQKEFITAFFSGGDTLTGRMDLSGLFSSNFYAYKGTGYYWCEARYTTNDPMTITNGDWSAMVGPYYYQEPRPSGGAVAIIDEPEEPEEEEPETPAVTFTDVPADAWYADAVAWAVANGITSGTGDGTTFSPTQECTRAQAVTFLWNAAGKPEPAGTANFTDVPADAWYAKAVAWALENGVTAGTGDGSTFSPTDICDRAQIVTFMWNAAKKPAAGQNSFTDVKAGSWYDQAVSWAVANEITSGVGGGRFGPTVDCDRAQIVTFLYNEATK